MQKKYTALLHILVWLIIFIDQIFPSYQDGYYKSDTYHGLFLNFFLITLGYFCIRIITFYSTAYFIAPKLFDYKKWPIGLLRIVFFLVFITFFRFVLEFHLFLPYLDFHNYSGETPEIVEYTRNCLQNIYKTHFYHGFVFYILSQWYINSKKQKELENEKLASELAFLKSQINPHFLFNTLNDIYALAYHKSPEASNAVLKLSELLRYMLKDSDGTFADLKKEVDYLKNAIELHQIGQKGKAYINFEIEGEIHNQKVAPLILINFLENAFKHGVVDNPSNPIQIKLEIKGNHLLFIASNLKNHDHKDTTGGIGLTNVRRRLDLIYPEKHKLEIEENDRNFIVSLKIELND